MQMHHKADAKSQGAEDTGTSTVLTTPALSITMGTAHHSAAAGSEPVEGLLSLMAARMEGRSFQGGPRQADHVPAEGEGFLAERAGVIDKSMQFLLITQSTLVDPENEALWAWRHVTLSAAAGQEPQPAATTHTPPDPKGELQQALREARQGLGPGPGGLGEDVQLEEEIGEW